jgi:hypothetical protein
MRKGVLKGLIKERKFIGAIIRIILVKIRQLLKQRF